MRLIEFCVPHFGNLLQSISTFLFAMVMFVGKSIHRHFTNLITLCLSHLRLIMLIAICSSAAACFGASSCAKLIPPAGGVVDIVRTSTNEELHELLDDYTYKKNYGTEDEAIADGFSVGFRVYGQPLQVGGQFDQAKKKTWFDEYEHRKQHRVDSAKATAFESIKQNVDAIREITRCIVATEGFGILGGLQQTGDCTASFTAWYRASQDDAPPLELANPPLKVQGGSCDPWPKKSIGSSPGIVDCRRSGRDALVVTIRTTNGPSMSDHIEALPTLGSRPVGHDTYEDTLSKPATKDFTLFHQDFTFWNLPGTDLGDYKMTFFADLPAPNGGKVQSADLLRCTGCGAHFWLCPDKGICPHPLFESVNNGTLLDLFGIRLGGKLQGSSIRLWAYRNSTDPPIELQVKLHYFDHEMTCVKDCGADQAKANWDAENARTCPVIRNARPHAGFQ
jgi:hypothetical protein